MGQNMFIIIFKTKYLENKAEFKKKVIGLMSKISFSNTNILKNLKNSKRLNI